MGVLGESWCFCNGGGKSERIKASLFSAKGPAMASISSPSSSSSATAFLIHRNLLLTTHVNLPSLAAAEASEIRLQDGLPATLFPHRFFITSSVLDLTIVGLDTVEGDTNAQGQHPHYLKTCSKPNLDLGSVVYLLGYSDQKELIVGEGKVVIATDNLIKMSTDGVTWSPGSAGFDAQGNLAFMVCDPMKLATSPNTKSSSTSSSSSSSWKKDVPMQFGIPIPIICDWLKQHWEGSLDELNKPKLPLIRLMSTGQKSEHSCASFTMRRVFKSTEADNDGTPSSSNVISKPRDQQHRPTNSSNAANTFEEEVHTTDPHGTHLQGIPTPEIYESPKLTAVPVRMKESSQIQLLDINFPPRVAKTTNVPQSANPLPSNPDKNYERGLSLDMGLQEKELENRDEGRFDVEAEIASNGSVNAAAQSEVQSCSSPVGVTDLQNGGYSSEGGETMYSAETAESRNYTSPREGRYQHQQVGRSQSCVNYNRWGGGGGQRNPMMSRRAYLEQQRSLIQGRKMHSQGATSQRSNDYFSPTVSSIMKKRNNSSEQPSKPPRQSAAAAAAAAAAATAAAVHSSPRWMF